ncbi:sigma-54 interaction domain-containing protein [Rhodovibrionaceae bacterium A322]
MIKRGGKAAEDEAQIRRQAARSLADVFDRLYEGAFAIDLDGRISWMNGKFKALIGWNGVEPVEGRLVEEVVPDSHMREVVETGEAQLLDVFVLGSHQLVVSRIPLTNAEGQLTGAMGVILYHKLAALKPLIGKFQAMQRDLSAARQELAQSRRAKYGFGAIVGNSAVIRQVKRDARRAAERDTPVLLLGETGTGKELFAHAIHASSPRASGPLVRVNIAAIPESLLEAELFGVAPGAFTGADRRGRAGKFQTAEGGTLFLDEIGDLPLALQPKLLRVLEEKEVEALGSDKVRPVDVRVISATSRDLAGLVEEGQFRADLFYRLNGLPLTLPSLAERRTDIPLIAEALLDQLRNAEGRGALDIEPDALELLARGRWKGNVRELRNVLEQALLRMDEGGVVTADLLETLVSLDRLTDEGAEAEKAFPSRSDVSPEGEVPDPSQIRPLKETLAEVEREAIRQALLACGGVRSKAAKLLGVSRAQFYQKMANLDLND